MHYRVRIRIAAFYISLSQVDFQIRFWPSRMAYETCPGFTRTYTSPSALPAASNHTFENTPYHNGTSDVIDQSGDAPSSYRLTPNYETSSHVVHAFILRDINSVYRAHCSRPVNELFQMVITTTAAPITFPAPSAECTPVTIPIPAGAGLCSMTKLPVPHAPYGEMTTGCTSHGQAHHMER